MRRLAIISCVALAVTSLLIAGCGGGCVNCGNIDTTRQDVSAAQVQMMIGDGNPLQIVDVRTAGEYATGIISGAVNIPVDQIKGPAEELAALDKKVRTVVYCASGNRSVVGSQALLSLGFTRVFNLLGGIEGWPGATELPDCGCGG